MEIGGWKLDTDQSLITNYQSLNNKGAVHAGQPLELARRYSQVAGSMDTGVRHARRIRITTRMLIIATESGAIIAAALTSDWR